MAPPSPWSSTYRALVAPTLGVSNETNSLFALSPPKKKKKEKKKKKREWISRQTLCFALGAEEEGEREDERIVRPTRPPRKVLLDDRPRPRQSPIVDHTLSAPPDQIQGQLQVFLPREGEGKGWGRGDVRLPKCLLLRQRTVVRSRSSAQNSSHRAASLLAKRVKRAIRQSDWLRDGEPRGKG